MKLIEFTACLLQQHFNTINTFPAMGPIGGTQKYFYMFFFNLKIKAFLE